MNIETALLADCWQDYAKDMYQELRSLCDSLRIEIPGFNGLTAFTSTYWVKEGLLRLSFYIGPDCKLHCKASLQEGKHDKVIGTMVVTDLMEPASDAA